MASFHSYFILMFILILTLIPIVLFILTFILIFNMILILQKVSSFRNQIQFNQTPEWVWFWILSWF